MLPVTAPSAPHAFSTKQDVRCPQLFLPIPLFFMSQSLFFESSCSLCASLGMCLLQTAQHAVCVAASATDQQGMRGMFSG